MSFTLIQQAKPRLHRSELAVPGSNPTFMEKSASSAADVIFLDLEDAVAPDDKEKARTNIIQALNDLDWGNKTMMIRINGLDTHYMYRDVVDIVEACPRLDMVLIPKVGVPADVYAIDVLVTQIELAKKRSKRIGFDIIDKKDRVGIAHIHACRIIKHFSIGRLIGKIDVIDIFYSTRKRNLLPLKSRHTHVNRKCEFCLATTL